MGLKVIGTGFGRTGTDSMREALNILGLGPCHHMYELTEGSDQQRLWRGLAAGGKPNWDQLLAGYSSCVDWPSAAYWRDLIRAYPDARVLLTWRSAESWWASFEKTILPHILSGSDAQELSATLIAPKVFGGDVSRDHAIATYEAHVAEVRATVPANRFLVHNLGDGWAPLCAHLGVAVPDQPYPRRNSTDEFITRNV